MKVRTDFVSNSSSSSYVIKLDKRVEDYTLEEFKKLFRSDRALEYIFEQLQGEDPLENKDEQFEYTITVSNEWSPDERGYDAESYLQHNSYSDDRLDCLNDHF